VNINSPNGSRGVAVADIAFERVSKRFGDVAALSDLDLHIPTGAFMTLLGPSGSGKTTALNVLAGFLNPSEGRVKIGGTDITSRPPEARNLGMVFQNYSLFPHLSVEDNVGFPLKMRGIDRGERRRRVGAALERVHLAGYQSRRPSELSGGQKQRVALARALVFEPPVLLMDECLSALDLKLREQLQIEIKRIHQDIGSTIVFVTHDQGEALAMSDSIAVMQAGRLVQLGTPHDIYDRPSTRFTADFIGKTNILDARIETDGSVLVPRLAIGFAKPASWPDRITGLSIRPESFSQDGTAPMLFPVTVESTLFLGETVQYVVSTSQGDEILFRESRRTNQPIHGRGDTITLGFAPESAWPLQD